MTRRHALRLTATAAIGCLTGRLEAAAANDPEKPFPWIGKKFTADGRVLPFPGNTIICPIGSEHPARAPLQAFRAALEAEPYAHKFTFTPPSSYHMTVFEGVVDAERRPGFWPSDLSAEAPLDACNRLFLQKLEAFDLGCAPRFRMKVMEGPGNIEMRPGAGIYLVPVDDEENRRLRQLRDRLADLLKLRQPNHQAYKFHTTQTYAITPLTEAETLRYRAVRRASLEVLAAAMPVLELGAPAFCVFEDMFAFNPRLYLQPVRL
ncbi:MULTISPECIES: DUF1868 domain-containing protein [unclassified Methylobacterium]|jgi:hypothetical protein|uniref:DUF1868 domain-containing protein n=1 Tax=unclassified Methylobacterium TaxID=2615210 RepID=UPI001FEE2E14|nr:DUF1868 domain-containing protein [Methylobacterium sp. 2A]